MQVVVTQYKLSAGAKTHHQFKRFQGARPTVDQVAAEHERRVIGYLGEQSAKGASAALHIADRVVAQLACLATGMRGTTLLDSSYILYSGTKRAKPLRAS